MYKLTIYVPGTSNITEYVNNGKYVRVICQTLSAIYGGCSVSTVDGYYVANDGQLVLERVDCVYTFGADAQKLAKTGNYVARWIKRVMAQETVLITIEEMQQVSFV